MLKVKVFTLSFLLLTSCGPEKDKPSKEDAPDSVRLKYEEALTRLGSFQDPSPWVVSRNPDATPEHRGDSLIWTGILVSSLPCDQAKPVAEGLVSYLWPASGEIFRHPELPDQASLDGALGLYRGIASTLSRCDWAADLWRPWVESHLQYLDANSGRFNQGNSNSLVREFTYVLDGLAWRLGLRGKPDNTRGDVLAGQLTAWANAVVTTKAACFRIHLGYQIIRTLDETGLGLSPRERGRWCAASAGTDIPLIDWYCSRGQVKYWIENFEYDTWEYRHQRCGAWETPDGRPGLKTPALDLIHAISERYHTVPPQNIY